MNDGKKKVRSILYISLEYPNEASGVWKKIISQCQALHLNGIRTYLVCNTTQGISLFTFANQSWELEDCRTDVSGKKNLFEQVISYKRLLDFAAQKASVLSCNNIYIRAIPLLPFMLSFLKNMHQESRKIFWEIPTFPYRRELIDKRNIKTLVFDLLFFRFLKRYVSHFVIVSDRIQADQFKEKLVMFSNGINVEKYSIRVYKPDPDVFHMIGVAHYSYWHGYDRLLSGMQHYYQSGGQEFKVHLHLIGPEMDNLQELTTQYGLKEYVTFYGDVASAKLDDLFNLADIAVASLAMHRKKFRMTSELKIREYFARGIPYLAGCHDIDIPENYPYKLVVSSDDSPIDINQIIRFVQGLPESTIYNHAMRTFAHEKLDWVHKMETIAKRCM